jgi:hypothetical protein
MRLEVESGAVSYIDDVGPLTDDGQYVRLPVYCAGELVQVLVMTPANFYDCLGKLVSEAMPGSVCKQLN